MLARTSSPKQGSERLARRRRGRRRRAVVALFILLLLLAAAAVYGLRQDAVRISSISIFNGDPALEGVVRQALEGSYLGLIPRDSIFFFPESRVRAAILVIDPGIVAVSIFRESFDGLSIKIDSRVAVARWCGVSRFDLNASSSRSNLIAGCYVFDANGLIYSTAATTSGTVNAFILYAPLNENAQEPLHATLANAEHLPAVFDFARQLATLGSPASFILIRDGEVDNQLTSGTRVTYVLGDEQNAFTALVSSKENFNLADGSIDYIDLRFPGKVYLKRKE